MVYQTNDNIKNFKYFVVSIFVFTLVSLVESRFEFNLPLLRYTLIFSASFFLIKSLSISKTFRSSFKGVASLFLFLLILFLFYTIVIGLPELLDASRNNIKLKQFIGEKALLYSIPLILFIRPNPKFWSVFLRYSYILFYCLIPFIIIDLAPYFSREKSPETLIRATAGVSGFLLLVSPYLKANMKNIILTVYLFSLLTMIYHARRNMVLYFGSFLIFYFYLRFLSDTLITIVSRWKTALNTLFLAIVGSIVFLLLNPDFSLFFERANTGMQSREGVIEDFLLDIVPGSKDFYFGRGMFGEFYSSDLGFDEFGNVGSGYRSGIENGYLQLILNFGFIYLLAFVILSLTGFIIAFLKSNNLFAKACGALVLINLIDMIGFGIPELTFRYILVWLALAFCFSVKFRKLSDLEIKNIIFKT